MESSLSGGDKGSQGDEPPAPKPPPSRPEEPLTPTRRAKRANSAKFVLDGSVYTVVPESPSRGVISAVKESDELELSEEISRETSGLLTAHSLKPSSLA